MLVIDSENKIHSNITDLDRIFSSDQVDIFNCILEENGFLQPAEFLFKQHACIIFLNKRDFIICEVKDLAGLRMIPLTDVKLSVNSYDKLVWDKLEMAAQYLRADMVQVLIPFPDLSKFKFRENLLMENYVFEKEIRGCADDRNPIVTKLDFYNSEHVYKIAELEFLTRLIFPSSSYKPKDNFLNLLAEYQSFNLDSDTDGLSISDDPALGHIIWWRDPIKRSAIVIHLWISEANRGRRYGRMLLNSMIDVLKKNETNRCRYFVSASNISAIKTLMQCDFVLKYVVVNRLISKIEGII